jgi:hypothetical protein
MVVSLRWGLRCYCCLTSLVFNPTLTLLHSCSLAFVVVQVRLSSESQHMLQLTHPLVMLLVLTHLTQVDILY